MRVERAAAVIAGLAILAIPVAAAAIIGLAAWVTFT